MPFHPAIIGRMLTSTPHRRRAGDYQPGLVRAFGGRAADVWSLGVTMFYLSVGHLPFDAPDVAALHRRIAQEKPAFPVGWGLTGGAGGSAAAVGGGDDDVGGGESQDVALRGCLERMLCKDPDARIRLADLLADAWVTHFGACPMADPAAVLPSI